MAFIRFLIGLFYKEENKLEKNLEEWNSYFGWRDHNRCLG